jgi:sugar phosphate isomerase/epimerase
MLYLIEDYQEVMVCFDSNHLLTETHNSFFKAVGNRIGTIHASDYDMTDERHWLPGKGVIDWPSFLTSLMNYCYDGVFMTEVKSAKLDEVCRSYTDVICKTN